MCPSLQCRLRPGVGTARRGTGGDWRRARAHVAHVARVALLALGAMLATLAFAQHARAEARFAFSWRAVPGASCLTEQKLRKAVEKKLERSVFSPLDEADIAIEGEEVVDGPRYRAQVRQHDRAGRELGARELTADTCEALERMTVVFIALVLEPGEVTGRLRSETPPATPADEPAAPPAPPPEPIAPKDQVPIAPGKARTPRSRRPSMTQRARPHPAELHVGVGVGAAVGILPSPSASVRLMTRLTVQNSRLSADWSVGLSLPQNMTEGLVRASFAGVDQQVRGCWAWLDRTSSRIETCAGALFGALVPARVNLDERSGAAVSLLGPEASLALRLSDGPVTVHVELGVAALALRHTISYLARDGEDRTLYSMPPFVAMGTLAGTFRAF